MLFHARPRMARSVLHVALVFTILAASGCAFLPSSGPTGGQIMREAEKRQGNVDFQIVELNSFADLPSVAAKPDVFLSSYAPPPTDLIGPNDELDISIYEAGVTLFSGSGGKVTGVAATAVAEPAAQVERLPATRVNDKGYIQLPYIGSMRAAGSTTTELAAAIRRGYRGLSQNPQVLVGLRNSVNNSILIGGEVARPGRLVLPTNQETLSDAIALAGGYRGEAKDITVRIQRQASSYEFRLSDILDGPERDMRVFPGDRVAMVRLPRSFAVMGGAGKVEQLPFSGPRVSLAEAMAQAGGAHPDVGDPAAIFVFRLVPQTDGSEKPVVYHLNMMKPGGYFLSQRFGMIDKDVLYIGNARANQPSKLIQIVSQLFSPIVTARYIVGSGN